MTFSHVPPPPRSDADADDRSSRAKSSTAAAWSAAAVVLGIGALVFAVLAHIRITDLENRVNRLETEVRVTGTGDDRLVDPSDITTDDIPDGGTSDGAAGPLDPAGAQASVIDAFSRLYDPAESITERLRYVDDDTGVADAVAAVSAGPNAAAVNSVKVNVNNVEFTSPTRAKVIYGFEVPGQPPVLGRSGEARVVAGEWKVTRATVCADLEPLGGDCG